ncbi:MAG: hypothetical protein DM484_02675 [Candidatus Methylumidiphilus alinenensis]|uniref:DUF4351 domain-containing protein n=1 Tax=Candidatus Methylumidiphilus alinenensis TaxID=2202197 RepID=A0A2W4TQT6_9GAMM|nr:MAG: hypothetical protein DM484_02675 [Candidatus Methylumidiphilus alinenensis]
MEISISIEHLTREANLREGAVRILKRQLHYRFGKLSPTIERHLDEASVGQLERWAASVLEANRLEDIFTLNIGKRLEICNEHLRCRASRIGDGRYVSLARQCLSIEVDYALWWELGRDSKDRESWMNLAKFYAAFSEAFGECGTRYYDWKGAFNFAFEVDVFNGETPNQYLLNVVNFRNTVEFRYGKIIPDTETRYDRHIMHAPFDEEFSAKQMGTLSAFLLGYAEGFLETAYQPYGRDFIKEVGSNLILFGCHEGVFFQKHFDDEYTFNLEKLKWRNHNLNIIDNET